MSTYLEKKEKKTTTATQKTTAKAKHPKTKPQYQDWNSTTSGKIKLKKKDENN